MKLKNPFLLDVFASRTSAEDPLQKFKFKVTIPDFDGTIGFQKVSGLSMETGVVEYDECGFDHTHKLPGRTSYSEVTLERGMFSDDSMLDKVKAVVNTDFRCTMQIDLCDRFGTVKRTWKLAEAWFSKWEGSDFDTSSDDVAIETLTVQYEYLISANDTNNSKESKE